MINYTTLEACKYCGHEQWTCHCKSCVHGKGMDEWLQYHCTSCKYGERMGFGDWICKDGVLKGIVPAAKVFYPDDSMYEPDC